MVVIGKGNEQSTNVDKGGVNLINKLRDSNKESEAGLENTREEHNKYMNEQNNNEILFKQKMKIRMQENYF